MINKEKGIFETVVILSLAILSLGIACCEQAYAEENRRMYLTESSFAYLFPGICDDYAAAVYGADESVLITGEITVKDRASGKRMTFYKTEHFGRTVYLPQSVLTSHKPKWACSAEKTFLELHLDGKAKLYAQPSKKSQAVLCSEEELYTLGKTNFWYKVFYQGQALFIRKTDAHIENISDAVFPSVSLSGIAKSEIPELKSRVAYTWALLPQELRTRVEEKLVTIHVVSQLPHQQFREIGAGAYASSSGEIYLREDLDPLSSCTVEMCLLHELGHMLQYALYHGSNCENAGIPSVPEDNRLNLREYYLQKDEYLAETFEIFIKNPQRLKLTEPSTYDYFSKLI